MNKYLSKLSLNIEPLTIDICDKNDKGYRHSDLGVNSINPAMKTFLESLGVGVLMVEVFYTPPFMNRGIHIDTAQGGDITKLNWVYCEGDHIMNWYEPKPDAPRNIAMTGVSTNYVSYKDSEVNLVHSEKMTTNNIIVQVGSPHNVRNLRYPRWALCFTICYLKDNSRITIAEAQEIFKDYLVN
jgi:hypothetical protein